MQQAAIVGVGDSNAKVKRVTVTFPLPFATVPVVVANTLQDPAFPTSIADTFAVSITGASRTGFTANIYRVDLPSGNGWGQNLSLEYSASTP